MGHISGSMGALIGADDFNLNRLRSLMPRWSQSSMPVRWMIFSAPASQHRCLPLTYVIEFCSSFSACPHRLNRKNHPKRRSDQQRDREKENCPLKIPVHIVDEPPDDLGRIHVAEKMDHEYGEGDGA